MSRRARLAVTVAVLMSLFAALSSTAGAATWHNSGSTTFHATTGPTTISSTGAGLVCTAGTVTGTVSTTPFVVPVGSWQAATGTAVFSPCTLGVSGPVVHCQFTVTAQTWTAGPPAVTNGTVDLYCTTSLNGVAFCVTEGGTVGTYTNPTGTTAGKGTLPTGDPVTVTNGPGGTCPLGNGDIATLSDNTYNVTSVAGSPVVTRTA